jgi:hypothetical protein
MVAVAFLMRLTLGGKFEEKIGEFLDKNDELVVLLTPWALENRCCMD